MIDDYHGTAVPDPYRWLEDSDSPETRGWIEAQNALTHAQLEAIPERDAIHARLEQIAADAAPPPAPGPGARRAERHRGNSDEPAGGDPSAGARIPLLATAAELELTSDGAEADGPPAGSMEPRAGEVMLSLAPSLQPPVSSRLMSSRNNILVRMILPPGIGSPIGNSM